MSTKAISVRNTLTKTSSKLGPWANIYVLEVAPTDLWEVARA